MNFPLEKTRFFKEFPLRLILLLKNLIIKCSLKMLDKIEVKKTSILIKTLFALVIKKQNPKNHFIK